MFNRDRNFKPGTASQEAINFVESYLYDC